MAQVTYLRARNQSLSVGGHPPVAAATIPVLNSLVYAGLYSGGASFAEKNWAPGGADGVLVGEPTEPGRFLNLGVGCYIDTGLPEYLACTKIVIGKAPSSGFAPLQFISSAVSGGSSGISLFAFSATSVASSYQTTGANAGLTRAANIHDWGMYCGIAPSSGVGIKLINLTAGLEIVSANTLARAITGPETMRIGASYAAGSSGPVDILCALYFNRAVTQQELNALAAWGRGYAADFGLTV